MKTYQIKHIDAFTHEPFSGNPAGVVLDAKGLSDAKMQAIAREMNLSETALVLPATSKSADLQIRWFTPNAEVPLCGHATIAGFHALAEEELHGMKGNGTYSFGLQTKSGILGIVVEKKFSGTIVEFQIPVPKFRTRRKVPPELLRCLGVRSSEVLTRLPYVSSSYLYLPLKKLTTLKSLEPDYARLRAFNNATRTLGVCVFSLKTIEESSSVHSRFFAPAVGIDEDPVTGSANGPLGYYLYRYAVPAGHYIPSLILPDARIEFIGEQGDFIGRRGRVKIRLRVSGAGVKHLSIAGEALTVMNSTLRC